MTDHSTRTRTSSTTTRSRCTASCATTRPATTTPSSTSGRCRATTTCSPRCTIPTPTARATASRSRQDNPLPMLLTTDPPEHTDLRRLVSRAFTPRRVADLEPEIRALAERFLERTRRERRGRSRRRLRGPAPDGRDRAHARRAASTTRSSSAPGRTRCSTATKAFPTSRPRASPPRPTSTSTSATSSPTGAPRLPRAARPTISPPRCAAAGSRRRRARRRPGRRVLLPADHRRQRDHHEAARQLPARACSGSRASARKVVADPGRIPDAVEEILRYEGSTQLMARTLTRPVELHGEQMPEGAKVLLLLGSANRDERVWDRPDEFDIDRSSAVQHVGFGHGIHVCLGAALARLEMRVSLEEIFRRRCPTTRSTRPAARACTRATCAAGRPCRSAGRCR